MKYRSLVSSRGVNWIGKSDSDLFCFETFQKNLTSIPPLSKVSKSDISDKIQVEMEMYL